MKSQAPKSTREPQSDDMYGNMQAGSNAGGSPGIKSQMGGGMKSQMGGNMKSQFNVNDMKKDPNASHSFATSGRYNPGEAPKHFVPSESSGTEPAWKTALKAKLQKQGGATSLATGMVGGPSVGSEHKAHFHRMTVAEQAVAVATGDIKSRALEAGVSRADLVAFKDDIKHIDFEASFQKRHSGLHELTPEEKQKLEAKELKERQAAADSVGAKLPEDKGKKGPSPPKPSAPKPKEDTGIAEEAAGSAKRGSAIAHDEDGAPVFKDVKVSTDGTTLPKTDKYICVRTCGMVYGDDFDGDYVVKIAAGTKAVLRRTKAAGFESKIAKNLLFIPITIASKHLPELDGTNGWIPWSAWADEDWVSTPRDSPIVQDALADETRRFPKDQFADDQKRGIGPRIVYEMEKLRTDTKNSKKDDNEHFYLAEVNTSTGLIQVQMGNHPRYEVGVDGEYTVEALELEKKAVDRLPPDHKYYYLHLLQWLKEGKDISEKQKKYYDEMQDVLHFIRKALWAEGEEERVLVRAALAKVGTDGTHLPVHHDVIRDPAKLGPYGPRFMMYDPKERVVQIAGSFKPQEMEEKFTPRERSMVVSSANLMPEPLTLKLRKAQRKPSKEVFQTFRFQQPGTVYVNNTLPPKFSLLLSGGNPNTLPAPEVLMTPLPLGAYEGVCVMPKGFADVFCMYHLKLRTRGRVALLVYMGVGKYMRRLIFKGYFNFTEGGADIFLDDLLPVEEEEKEESNQSPANQSASAATKSLKRKKNAQTKAEIPPLKLLAVTELFGDLRVSFKEGELDKFMSHPTVHARIMKGIRKARLDYAIATTGKVPTIYGPSGRDLKEVKDGKWLAEEKISSKSMLLDYVKTASSVNQKVSLRYSVDDQVEDMCPSIPGEGLSTSNKQKPWERSGTVFTRGMEKPADDESVGKTGGGSLKGERASTRNGGEPGSMKPDGRGESKKSAAPSSGAATSKTSTSNTNTNTNTNTNKSSNSSRSSSKSSSASASSTSQSSKGGGGGGFGWGKKDKSETSGFTSSSVSKSSGSGPGFGGGGSTSKTSSGSSSS
ncbi:unnamed protein product [Amoebophrya sp. A25]|nr:unnamed protein product [Amoebophrya sp. A25]|eukprot:GSA25T00024643001.1